MFPMNFSSLREGAMYLVQYQDPTKRLPRQAAMKFLNETKDSLIFSARPTAGTQSLPKSWVLLIEERAPTITPYVGKVVR